VGCKISKLVDKQDIRNPSNNDALDWTFKGKIWHHWEIYRNGKLMASLHSRRYFGLRFEGEYDGKGININKELMGKVILSDKDSGAVLGSIDVADHLPATFSLKNGKTYTISSPRFRVIHLISQSDSGIRTLCITEFDNTKSFHIGAMFTKVDIREEDPNPWLMAIVTLYVAIVNSYGSIGG
jgi:hypothetical protein